MKDPNQSIDEICQDLLTTFPASQISDDLREKAIDWIEDGHPAEYYAGVMRGILVASAKAAGTGKKANLNLSITLMTLTVGVAIRYKESCSMEVK